MLSHFGVWGGLRYTPHARCCAFRRFHLQFSRYSIKTLRSDFPKSSRALQKPLFSNRFQFYTPVPLHPLKCNLFWLFLDSFASLIIFAWIFNSVQRFHISHCKYPKTFPRRSWHFQLILSWYYHIFFIRILITLLLFSCIHLSCLPLGNPFFIFSALLFFLLFFCLLL